MKDFDVKVTILVTKETTTAKGAVMNAKRVDDVSDSPTNQRNVTPNSPNIDNRDNDKKNPIPIILVGDKLLKIIIDLILTPPKEATNITNSFNITVSPRQTPYCGIQ